MLRTILAAVAMIAVAGIAHADPFDDARLALCEKTKTCAMAQMESAENMNEQMQAMVMQSLDRMCEGMERNFSAALQTHELYEPATECMQAMAEMECSMLMDDGADTAPACVRYRELAAEYDN